MPAASGTCVCTREPTHLKPKPFMSCWNRYAIGKNYGYTSMAV